MRESGYNPPLMKSAATNVTRHAGLVSPEDRAAAIGQKGATVWLTGLSGSGKSTIAHELEARLVRSGRVAYVLDGDNIRLGLNSDLGFSPKDRAENIRRIGEVARLFVDAGVIAITAFISPYRNDRGCVRAMHPDGAFLEVHVDCPIAVCEGRDTKGLYARARKGEVADFTGVSAPYEAPENPELRVDTSASSLDECVASVVRLLEKRGRLRAAS